MTLNNTISLMVAVLSKLTTTCGYDSCRATVRYVDTVVVSEPVRRKTPTYPGMATHTERRVCRNH